MKKAIAEDEEGSEDELHTRKLVSTQNKKKKKSGGFQSMGLSQSVFKGILKKGYKVPTPIQRKCIPVIMEGKDIVGMARTGSGKTAAFLIPLFERLQSRSVASGARALIMSPTRELALQTLKFSNELGRFTGLKAIAILGGNKMEDQFAAIHENPDIIIATPGRFLHILMEMDLKLNNVEYVVFDEADRLFEMGFQEQLREIIGRLAENRQTLLFSATLPKLLVDFAKAGLNEPILVRLDVDTKLSDNLKLAFICGRSEDKLATLLYLLRNVIKPEELTVVFVSTKHHIEYLTMILEKSNISCTYIYSSLDQFARKANVAKFQKKKASVMLVTDIAARGIDIPLLDNVINFDFPPKSKIFVHRVGRVARAGRSGTAFSLVNPEEMPYVLDLYLFLGRSIKCATEESDDWDSVLGSVPRSALEDNEESLQLWHENSVDLKNMKRVCSNAYKQYLKSRPVPSTESIRRMKQDLALSNLNCHPLFRDTSLSRNVENERMKILQSMKSYKPHTTIFEVNATSKSSSTALMKQVRLKNSKAIRKHQLKLRERLEEHQKNEQSSESTSLCANLASKDDIKGTFTEVVAPRKRASGEPFEVKKKKKRKLTDFKDSDYYLPSKASDHHTELGLEIDKSSFDRQVKGEVLDLTGEDADQMRRQRSQKKWDRKKKKFVQEGGKEKKVKKVKTESGVWIPASYKTDLYKQWQHKSKVGFASDSDNDESDGEKSFRGKRKHQNQKPMQGGRKGRKDTNNNIKRPLKRELKTKDEILKARRIQAKKAYQERNTKGRKRRK